MFAGKKGLGGGDSREQMTLVSKWLSLEALPGIGGLYMLSRSKLSLVMRYLNSYQELHLFATSSTPHGNDRKFLPVIRFNTVAAYKLMRLHFQD
jgi:hypothetical protein